MYNVCTGSNTKVGRQILAHVMKALLLLPLSVPSSTALSTEWQIAVSAAGGVHVFLVGKRRVFFGGV